MFSIILEQFNDAIVIVLMMTGLYIVFSSRNMIKKLVGLSIFQTSVFLLYITIGKVEGAQPPILIKEKKSDDYVVIETVQMAASGTDSYVVDALYSNPLPHVLILTAIVVGVATLAIGLALVVRIREVYQTIEEDDIQEQDYLFNLEGVEDAMKPNVGVSE